MSPIKMYRYLRWYDHKLGAWCAEEETTKTIVTADTREALEDRLHEEMSKPRRKAKR